MKERIIACTLLIFSAMFVTGSAFAEESVEKVVSDKFTEIPDTLPPGFTGTDLKTLIKDWLSRGKELGILRDEFTPTADFMRRATSFVDEVNRTGKFLFIFKDGLAKYDADKKEMEITLNRSSLSDDYRSTLAGIEFGSDYTSQGEYRAANAFNRAVTVKKSSVVRYMLGYTRDSLSNTVAPLLKDGGLWFKLRVPMAPDEARDSIRDLRILVAARLRAPPLLFYHYALTPTARDPFDSDVRAHALYAQIDEMWVINTKTGRIYKNVN